MKHLRNRHIDEFTSIPVAPQIAPALRLPRRAPRLCQQRSFIVKLAKKKKCILKYP